MTALTFFFRLTGWFLLELLGSLHFNVEVDSGFWVRLTLEAFMWRFSHGEGVFCPI